MKIIIEDTSLVDKELNHMQFQITFIKSVMLV